MMIPAYPPPDQAFLPLLPLLLFLPLLKGRRAKTAKKGASK
jgi:hypothetical protein